MWQKRRMVAEKKKREIMKKIRRIGIIGFEKGKNKNLWCWKD